MDDATKNIVREAMLLAQSAWLGDAAAAHSLTESTIARVIADAFGREAAKYKVADPNRVGIDTEKDLAFLHDM